MRSFLERNLGHVILYNGAASQDAGEAVPTGMVSQELLRQLHASRNY